MKYEKQDHAQFDNILERVQIREYLFKVKLEAFSDKRLPKCTIFKAEVVNPSTESHRLLSVINKLLLESSGSASMPHTSTGNKTFFLRFGIPSPTEGAYLQLCHEHWWGTVSCLSV